MQILLIEDDNDDIEFLQEALSGKTTYQMHIIKDGGLVSNYLNNCTDIPDIIIMDFNLPKVHGREILRDIRSRHAFQDIPLIILTTSSAQEDLDYSYKEGASQYLIKPVTEAGMNNVIDTIIRLAK